MPKYKRVKVNIKKDSLDKLLTAYLSGYAPSRASAAEMCSVSSVTSGKVANALLQSGLMTERQFALNGEHPCFHLFCRESARILLIDLSEAVFKMSIVSSYGAVKFRASHEYDPSLFPEDNIELFMSRCGDKAKHSGIAFCAISVIYADENSLPYLEGEFINAKLPHIADKEYIGRVVYSVFAKNPILHITVSRAIGEALKFKAHGNIIVSRGISYIFIGSHISLFHIHDQSSTTVCSPQTLMDIRDRDLLHKGLKKDDADALFLRFALFMAAAFSPSVIILESDMLSPDADTEELLFRRCAASGINAPLIYSKKDTFSLVDIGAVRSSLLSVIKRYIMPN